MSAPTTEPRVRTASRVGVVHIIDDDRDFRESMSSQLRYVGLETELYNSAEHFLATYVPQPIECGLLDLRMPGMHGFELQEALRRRYHEMQLIVISAYGTTPDIVQAVRNGAIDFLDKPVEEDVLISTVCNAMAKAEERFRIRSQRDQALWRLSDREREVLDLFIAAKSTVEIAHQLGISPKTVEKHRLHIFEKTSVGSIPELMRLVFEVN